MFCRHKICKGFVTMKDAENPSMVVKVLTRRMKKNVKAKRRVMLYDNACNMHKTGLRRGAKSISKFKVLVDRHQWNNHTGYSTGYNCGVNSQICEQKNRSLRKLSATLAHTKFSSYTI